MLHDLIILEGKALDYGNNISVRFYGMQIGHETVVNKSHRGLTKSTHVKRHGESARDNESAPSVDHDFGMEKGLGGHQLAQTGRFRKK